MSNQKFLNDFVEYNRLMKRIGSKPKTLEEYKTYRAGRQVKTSRITKNSIQASTYRRPSPSIPSGDTYDTFSSSKKEMKYTGDRLLGIAIMHKSNLVPVFSQEDAEDIARMRR